MKVYVQGFRKIWYDPHIRSWTLQTTDEFGNQVGDCQYDVSKSVAVRWLEGGDASFYKPSPGKCSSDCAVNN